MKRSSNRQVPGAVTVFLLLTVLLVTAVLLVSVEGARAAAGRLYFKQAAVAAAESTMASYRSDLWENYRLLFQYEDEDLEAEAGEILARYSASEGAGGLIGFSDGSVRVRPVRRVTEEGGRYLVQNAVDMMVFEEGKEAVTDFLGDSGLLKQIKTAASFLQTLLSYGEDLVELEKRLSRLLRLTEDMQTEATEVKKSGEKLEECAEKAGVLKAAVQAAEKMSREKDHSAQMVTEQYEKAYAEYTRALQAEVTAQQDLTGTYKEMRKVLNGYATKAEELGNALTKVLEGLETEKATFRKEIWALLEAEIAHIREYTEETGERQAFVTLLTSLLEGKEELDTDLETLRAFLHRNPDEQDYERVKEVAETLCEEAEEPENVQIPEWLVPMGVPSDFSLSDAFTYILREIFAQGFLIAFVENPDKLSQHKMTMKDLPSETLQGSQGGADFFSQVARRILFQDYLTTYFYGYTGNQEREMQYEWEYLLFGQRSDVQNLTEQVKELYLVREGTRFLENMQNAVLRERASQMALSCLGFTGNPAVIYMGQLFFLALWAADDAWVDVRELLKGEKRPFLSISGLENWQVSYRDYVRLEMYLVPMETLSGRAMDLIQNEIRKEDADFDVSRVLYSVRVTVGGQMPWLFASLPLVSRFFSEQSAGQTFLWSEECHY